MSDDVNLVVTIGNTEWVVHFAVADEITRLRARIQELERERITDEMIDKAWRHARAQHQELLRLAAVTTLNELGIVACEECGGSGQINGSFDEDRRPCDFCHGDGWVRRNDE